MIRLLFQFGTCLRSLSRNPMRAILTILGIVIGIASVIVMLEIGEGSTKQIQETMTKMGADTLTVRPSSTRVSGISSGSGSNVTLTPNDAVAILNDCPLVSFAAPVVNARVQAIAGNINWNPSQIIGSTPAYLNIRAWDELEEGVCFSEEDVVSSRPVCVIGSTIANQLFSYTHSPIGETLRLGKVNFQVIGVLKSKGSNMMGWDQDDIIVAPWTAIKYRVSGSGTTTTSGGSTSSSTTSTTSNSDPYPSTKVDYYPEETTIRANAPHPRRFPNIAQLQIKLFNHDDAPEASDQIEEVLRRQHKLHPGQPNDFEIRDMAEMARMMNSTTATMSTLLLCVAMISLVVGGIGIMNIMLVSVTERTKEIGLRMAVGARPVDIMRQFLFESILLCLIGGGAGIALGRSSSAIIGNITGWAISTSTFAIILAVGVSASIGIIFGWYPAWKASRLNPIDALRHE